MENNTINSQQNIRNIYYPPGGILIWFLMILEIFTFLGAILIFLHYRKENLVEFSESQAFMSPLLGTINTIILITSGLLMANSVLKLRENKHQETSILMLFGLLLGIVFLGIKGGEFYHKIALDIGLGYSTFFTFYWLLTGFHFVHVLLGIGILGYMFLAIRKKEYSAENMFDVEASATYWHLCDLIWILIFPILYLL